MSMYLKLSITIHLSKMHDTIVGLHGQKSGDP